MARSVKRQSRRKPLREPKNGLKALPLTGEPPKFQKRVGVEKVHRLTLRDWSGTKRLKAK